MTDPLAPLSDEDLSAVLDGEAPADVAARAEAAPTARARLAALRAASEAVRSATVPPLAPSLVDDLVARALAAADEPAADGAADEVDPRADDGADAVVAPLRRPGRTASGGGPRWLVAAAVVVLVGVGLVLVWSGRDDRSTDTAARSTAASSSKTDDDPSRGGSKSPDAETPTTERLGALPEVGPHGSPSTTASGGDGGARPTDLADLGTFATNAALRAAVKSSFPTAKDFDASSGSATARSVTTASVDRCDSLAQQIFKIDGSPLHRGVATVDGKVLYVYEYAYASEAAPGTTRLVIAAGQDSCDVEFSFVR